MFGHEFGLFCRLVLALFFDNRGGLDELCFVGTALLGVDGGDDDHLSGVDMCPEVAV